MKLIMTSILLSSCGAQLSLDHHVNNRTGPWIHSIDQEFQPYYDAFEDVCGIKPVVNIGFHKYSKDEPMTVGTCWEWMGVKNGKSYYYNQITISNIHWESASEEQREWTIFHELGHCTLGQDHGTGYMKPMYPNFNADSYKEQRESLIKDLCKNR